MILLVALAVHAAAADEIAIHGQAIFEDEPVAAVRVSLTPMVGNYGLGAQFLGLQPLEAPISETKTGGDGRFVVVAPTVGFWSLKLDAQGFAPSERILLRVVEESHIGQIELRPAEALEVVVTDGERRPETARISIFRTASALRGADFKSLGRRWRVASTMVPGTPWRMLPTDAEGRLVVDVASDDRLLVRAEAPGFVAEETITHGGGRVHPELKRGAERELRVGDPRGRALPGVLVFDERAEVPLTVTGDDGKAIVTWEASAPLRVMLLDGEGRRGTALVDPPRPDTQVTPDENEVTVALDPPATVRGRVIDRFTREPIVNALVWSDDLANYTHTGPTGEYEIHRLGSRVWITVLATDYVRGQARSADDGPAPTVSLHPTAALSGRVVDGNGSPLEAVEIGVWRDPERSDTSLKYTGWVESTVLERTDDDGTFKVSGLPARMAFRLSAYREGWAETELEVDPLEPFARREGLRLVLEPGRRAVGRVVNENDEALGGVSVTLLPRGERGARARSAAGNDGRQLKAETDTEGGFAIADIAPGVYDVNLVGWGHVPERVLGVEILEGMDDTDLGLFRLDPGATVEGRAVDRDGAPVTGVEVRVSNDPSLRLSQARQRLAREPAAAISDAQGRFTIAGQRPEAHLILVLESADHLPEVVGGLSAPTSAPVEIALRSPSGISGRVIDPEGRGVPQASLTLIPEGRAGSGGFGGPPHFAESRDDGSFEIQRVPGGRITLICSAGGFQDLRTSGLEVPEAGELADVELAMRAGAAIEGAVLDPQGEPVVNALVRILNLRFGRKGSRTDGDGRYRIDGLSAATVPLAADHEDFPRTAREVDIDLGTNVVDLVFGGGAAVSGQVRDALGEPVAGAWVRLVRALRTRHSPSTVSREDGSFLFAGVASGDYFVDAGRRGFAEHRLEPAIVVREQPVAGIQIMLERGTVVRGQILGLSRAELAQAEVMAYGQLGRHRGEVGPGSSYRVDHLAPGEWVIRGAVEARGRSVLERLTLESADREVELDLDFSAGFVLSGTVSHRGTALQGARVGARGLSAAYAGEATTDADGAFRLEGLEEGRYWVGLYDFGTGLRHSEEIEIEGDEEMWIELITDNVSGLVTNAFDHEPVVGARIALEPLLEDQEFAAQLLQPGGLSDSGGYFSLGDVSHGRYDLVVARDGYAESRTPLEVREPREDLEPELTPTQGIFFELSLAETGPVDWATAVVLDGDRQVAHGTWAASEKGRVRITSVPPGSYEMLIWAPGSATLSRSVLSPGDLGRIVLARGGTVDVFVPDLAEDGTVATLALVGVDGSRYRSAIGARLEDEFRLWAGRARVPGLPTGEWFLTVTAADGRSWTASATVSADQINEVTLE